MNKVKFLVEKTKASLKYLGVTGVIISLSVMFSAICLMSLLSLSNTVSEQIEMGTARETVGGDASLMTPSNMNEVLSVVEELKKEGKVKQYTYLSNPFGSFYIYSESLKRYLGDYFVQINVYEDAKYPLVESSAVSSKEGVTLKDLPKYQDGIILTEAFAKTLGVKIGDEISFASETLFDKYTFKIVGLLSEYVGSYTNVFINKGSIEAVGFIYTIFMDGDEKEIKSRLSEFGNVDTATGTEERIEKGNKMAFGLIRGLSIIGLFVGSFGIANSVNAIVTKRKREIGILKSIGFKKMDIMQMLLSEIFLIAVLGSILGIGIGYLFFYYLVDIISSLSLAGAEAIYLDNSFSIVEALISFVVSIVSSILFAFITINRVAEIKPIYALKDLEYTEKIDQKGRNFLRFLVIAVIFSGISIFLTKSVEYGVGAVALVTVGIVIFSLIFRLIFFLIVKIPVRTRNGIELAWGNLRLNYKKTVLPMIAIFIGMFAVLMIGTMIYSSKKYSTDEYEHVDGGDYNLVVKRHTPKDNLVEEKINSFSADIKKSTTVFRFVPMKYSETFPHTGVMSASEVFNIVEGSLTDEGVLIPEDYKDMLSLGDIINIPYMDREVVLPVKGYYQFDQKNIYESLVVSETSANSGFLVVTRSTFDKYFSEKFVEESWIGIDMSKMDEFTKSLADMQDGYIFTEKDIENITNLVLNLTIKFTTSIASLALLAGIILIATVTILDVVSKKRDFAILKTIGFKQGEVTSMVIFEYSIMSVITSIFATSTVYGVVLFVRRFGKKLFDINGKRFFFDVNGSIIWNIIIVTLVMLIVYFVSKNSLKTKPSEVLRYE